MRVALPDVPGTLMRTVEPISKRGGNIQSIVHNRNHGELVDVLIAFNVRDQETLDGIKDELEENNISIQEIIVEGKRYYRKKTHTFMLIGHVIDRDIQDTIDRINEVGLVSKVDVIMSDPASKSTVLMKVEYEDKRREKLLTTIFNLCKKKEFLYIGDIL